MKTLYLIRHAKSSWDNFFINDHERPLNKRGKKNAPDMGQRLANQNIHPDLLISSTAKRAMKTAKAIAKAINYPISNIQTYEDLYMASPGDILDIIGYQKDQVNSLMLFAHNPGITDLANQIGSLDIDNIPTCGIVAFEFNCKKWTDISTQKGKFIFFDYPKKVDEPRF
ncbi:SixA phosphatase family protein [Xanthovirga aplysinae]|uniref:SixA phosphatase family protein n=1 Tax=Xanthovirga aplysinae TaxID=2529853 RepID=UPI0012BCAA9E|nr:histidine phosphatase family protein [Xanthovirga aplysinae]MTI31048.1 histidine phosphatase family protein [Xanthovirga aplysinae]